MGWRVAADVVLVVHLAFVIFILVGGFLVRWRSWIRWPHLAALAYGGLIQLFQFTCPLTPLEKSLRRAAGDAGYEGGFIGHYIVPLLYPGEITPRVRLVLTVLVIGVNAVAYGWVAHRRTSPV